MHNLDKLELKLNIKKCETAKMEMEYKIEKAKEEIKRLQEHMDAQDKHINGLTEKLKNMES